MFIFGKQGSSTSGDINIDSLVTLTVYPGRQFWDIVSQTSCFDMQPDLELLLIFCSSRIRSLWRVVLHFSMSAFDQTIRVDRYFDTHNTWCCCHSLHGKSILMSITFYLKLFNSLLHIVFTVNCVCYFEINLHECCLGLHGGLSPGKIIFKNGRVRLYLWVQLMFCTACCFSIFWNSYFYFCGKLSTSGR